MQNKDELLNQIIDNLTLIKNSKTDFSQIEKDIVLQNLRNAYLLILRNQVSSLPSVPKQENNTKSESGKKVEEPQPSTTPVQPSQPISVTKEKSNTEKKVETTAEVFHKEEMPVEEKLPVQNEQTKMGDFDEMDSDILQFLNTQPKVETKSRPMVKTETKQETKPEVKPAVVDTPKVAVVEPKIEISEIKPKLEEVAKPEPKPSVQEPKPTVSKPEVKSTIPEIKPAPQPEIKVVTPPTKKMEEVTEKPAPKEAEKPVMKPDVPEVVVAKVVEPAASTQNPAKQVADTLFPEAQQEPVAEKSQQRSLNDLFNEQKRENSLGDKFQQKKVVDLTKAMTINDKFLFIRELFKNKSEEFSRAIQTLNNCKDIEEAFDIMEGLKKQYFWDSTSSAYLSLCDLVRRKF